MPLVRPPATHSNTACSNLYFEPLSSDVVMAVREVRGAHLGHLITVRGIVTRVSEVKPLLQVNAYTCDVCGSETFQDISSKTFQPIIDCENVNECKKNGVKGSLHMQTRACRFSPFQEVKIQEMVTNPLVYMNFYLYSP
jgi:DNA replication licensing factor MCM7